MTQAAPAGPAAAGDWTDLHHPLTPATCTVFGTNPPSFHPPLHAFSQLHSLVPHSLPLHRTSASARLPPKIAGVPNEGSAKYVSNLGIPRLTKIRRIQVRVALCSTAAKYV